MTRLAGQTLTGMKVGFIGLGLMGKPMARNLKAAGAELVVHNRSQAVVEELAAEGMHPAASPKEVAERAEIVICMLSDTPAVELVALGGQGLVHGVKPGSLIIDMGTTMATDTRRFADQLALHGAEWLDAPVSGGQVGAEAGSLVIMSGGSDHAMKRAGPLFDVMGSRTTHVGGCGAGQVAKAANQVIVGLTIGAVAEALALAKHAGVDPAKVREALKGGFADSRILELHGQRMIDGTFAPGGKCTTQRKDLDQALTLAVGLGLELPITELARHMYDQLIAAGHGGLDHSALFKLIDGDL